MAAGGTRASNLRKIRGFLGKDLRAIAEVVSASPEASRWPLESYVELADSPGGLLLVCAEGGEVSGFLAARAAAGEAEILNIAVAIASRRQGVASALLQASLDEFQRSHVSQVFLEVRESNAPAVALYRKFGFAMSGRRKDYYRNPVEDALCLMRKLTLHEN